MKYFYVFIYKSVGIVGKRATVRVQVNGRCCVASTPQICKKFRIIEWPESIKEAALDYTEGG